MDTDAVRPGPLINSRLAQILEELSRPDILRDQISSINNSNLPQPLKIVSEFLFSAQWLEYRVKALAHVLSELIYDEHAFLKVEGHIKWEKIEKYNNSQLIKHLREFKIKKEKTNSELKIFINDFEKFTKMRNTYTHHYFGTSEFETVENEAKDGLKISNELNVRVDTMLSFWQNELTDKLIARYEAEHPLKKK